MTDFHSHILPSMDDGASSLKMAQDMLKMSKAHGIDTIVATPHFYPVDESPDSFLERRSESIKLLQSGLGDGMPSVMAGAEIAYFTGIGQSSYLSSLCVIGTKTILVEMPFDTWSDTVIEDVARIGYVQGLNPVIAHVERYMSYQEKITLDKLADNGIMFQANASFFSDFFTKHKAINMLSEGGIHLLGSDSHNMSSRMPNMDKAIYEIEKRLGREAIEYIERNSDILLSTAIPIG